MAIECNDRAVCNFHVYERHARIWPVTASGDMVVVPTNSIAKAVVTNRSSLNQHHLVALALIYPQAVSPDKIDEIVLASAADFPAVLTIPVPAIAMHSVTELGVLYELDFYVAHYSLRSCGEV